MKNHFVGAAVLVVVGIVVRLLVFMIDMPFTWDVHTFQAWANMLYVDGFAQFYYSDAFTDYPPAYMYVLFVIGAIRSALDWGFLSPQLNLLTFSPAIISDIITGLAIYFISKDLFHEEYIFGKAFFVSMAYLLNPAVLINSSLWGQVDAVYTLLLFLALYAVYKKQILPVYMLYGLAVLTKPQSLMLAPIFLYSVFHYSKARNFTAKSILTVFGYGVGTFAFMALISLPFGIDLVIEQFFTTIGSRPFNSISAYNFPAMTGGTWQGITPFYTLITSITIVGVTLFTFWILYKRWAVSTIFATASLLFGAVFVFSTNMNERYMFPAVLFLLVAAIFDKSEDFQQTPQVQETPAELATVSQGISKPSKWYILYFAFSFTIFINCFDILLANNGYNLTVPFVIREAPPGLFRPIDEFVALIGFINVCLAIFLIRTSYFTAIKVETGAKK
ncbi:MAG: hypothetical protein FWG64_13290 [Firmicutes bacterium]|nr:hypothetical protein [Bacillota bacterium]